MAQVLFNLQTKDYEHPFDRAALDAMRALPMFDRVMNFFLNWTTIKWETVGLCGSAFHVTERSCPELYGMVSDVARTLEIDHIPEIYTEWTYGINAYTTGHKDDTILVLFTGAVDLMPEQELKYIIGHEMGHIKSGHVLYKVMAQFLGQIIEHAGILGNLASPIQYAMGYWNRMSEFTADRAGLLACQDLDASLSAIMKMAGLPKKYFNIADPHIFAEQAQEFLIRYGDTANTIIKNISIMDDSHPWTVLRASELIKWVESGEYEKIVNKPRKLCEVCNKEVEYDRPTCPECGGDRFIKI